MAAAVFLMEVISVGIMYYAALVPCVFSAFIGERISIFMGVRTLTAPYPVEEVPNFYGIAWGKAILLAICFAFAGALFCVMLHIFEKQLKKWFQNPYLRVFVGGVTVVLCGRLREQIPIWDLVEENDCAEFCRTAEIVGIFAKNIIYMYHTLFWF